MLNPSRDRATGVSEPPGDFRSNYTQLKNMIETAISEGTPLDALHLIPKDVSRKQAKKLSKADLIKLLHALRKIRSRYQRLLNPPVPRELERDVLAKEPEDRLPWETEALQKQKEWRKRVGTIRVQVQEELNDHLNDEFFADS